MRYELALVSVLVLTCLPATSQKNAQDIPTTGAKSTAPILLPQVLTISTPKHCDELDGVVKFAAKIDANGLPQGLKVLEASDRRLQGFGIGAQVGLPLRLERSEELFVDGGHVLD